MEWPGGKQNEPDEVLFTFLAKLPPMVKDSVLAGCMLAFELARLDPEQNKLDDLRSLLEKRALRDRHYQCAMMIAVVELCLEHSEGDAEYYQELYEKTSLKELLEISLRAPLRDRQFENARVAFRELREGILSARILHIWHGFLLRRDDEKPR
jgi:hypothetical protein